MNPDHFDPANIGERLLLAVQTLASSSADLPTRAEHARVTLIALKVNEYPERLREEAAAIYEQFILTPFSGGPMTEEEATEFARAVVHLNHVY